MCPWELLDQQGTARQRESWHGHGHGEEGVASGVGGCMGRAHAWWWSGFLGFHCIVAAAKADTLLSPRARHTQRKQWGRSVPALMATGKKLL